jgi:hypothetical protein
MPCQLWVFGQIKQLWNDGTCGVVSVCEGRSPLFAGLGGEVVDNA